MKILEVVRQCPSNETGQMIWLRERYVQYHSPAEKRIDGALEVDSIVEDANGIRLGLTGLPGGSKRQLRLWAGSLIATEITTIPIP